MVIFIFGRIFNSFKYDMCDFFVIKYFSLGNDFIDVENLVSFLM